MRACLTLVLLGVALVACTDRHHLHRRRKLASKACRVDARHHSALGAWASAPNATRAHLSMVQPTDVTLLTFVSTDGGNGVKRLSSQTTTDGLETPLKHGELLAGESDCPTQDYRDRLETTTSQDGKPADRHPLMARSLCPWYWAVNYDRRRIPSVLPEARCRCAHAVLSDGRKLACQAVTVDVRVVRFADDSDACDAWRTATERLAVACVGVADPQRTVIDTQHFDGVQRAYVLAQAQEEQ